MSLVVSTGRHRTAGLFPDLFWPDDAVSYLVDDKRSLGAVFLH